MSERIDFGLRTGAPERMKTGLLSVGVFERRRLSPAAESLNGASEGYLADVLRRGDLEGKVGQTLLLQRVPGIAAERVLLVGCGRERDLTAGPFARAAASAARAIAATAATDAVSLLPGLGVRDRDLAWRVRETVVATRGATYRFDRMKSEKEGPARALRRLTLALPGRRDLEAGQRGLREGVAIADGVERARDLANLPANVCTPAFLAEQARALAGEHVDTRRQARGEYRARLGLVQEAAQPAAVVRVKVVRQLRHQRGRDVDRARIAVAGGHAIDDALLLQQPAEEVRPARDACAETGIPREHGGHLPARQRHHVLDAQRCVAEDRRCGFTHCGRHALPDPRRGRS